MTNCGEFQQANKPLLLANSDFIPYCISGLFLDPDHPRANLKDEIKLWNQQTHAECSLAPSKAIHVVLHTGTS